MTRAYQRTVLPSLSGMSGKNRDAAMGNRIHVVNQGKCVIYREAKTFGDIIYKFPFFFIMFQGF